MSRALLQQALDALESATPHGATSSNYAQADAAFMQHACAIQALQSALAQPEPEPEPEPVAEVAGEWNAMHAPVPIHKPRIHNPNTKCKCTQGMYCDACWPEIIEAPPP